MGFASKTVMLVSGIAGLALFSQAPEFAQQYRQRIGGAVDELQVIVVDFDKDALASQMSRKEALVQLTNSTEKFPHERGLSMTKTIMRWQRLMQQQSKIEAASPILRPFVVLKGADSQIMRNAWQIYQPAVPLNATGVIYGGVGAFIAMLLARLGLVTVSRAQRRRSDRELVKVIESSNEIPIENLGDVKNVSDLPLQTDEELALLHDNDSKGNR